ncbi:hypothetical protein OV079_25955 [Nannocystis pusilla]|uniref:Uncharacterized protein n=1 Tax=Nannocystis pusilla TaxID=889268 RepID=A0A9X3IZT3_9BACT|nr:hypothetical protein [Nannocystis pusilla]MCY1008939.1 hypothetical protein [Nannocystis pusilla]
MSRSSVDDEVDAAVGGPERVRLDDGDPGDAVGHRLVGVAGDDDVDGAGREGAGDGHDLVVGLAAGEVVGVGEAGAAAAGVGGDDDDRGPARAQSRGLAGDRGRQRGDLEVADVGGDGGVRRALGGDANDADLDPGALDQGRGHAEAGRLAALAAQVGGQEGVGRLADARLQGPARVGLARAERGGRGGPGTDGAEVELVVADRDRVVAERGVGVDDAGALDEVRLEGALEHVAGVDEDHAAAVRGPLASQRAEVGRQQREGAQVAVQVAGADDGEGDAVLGRRLVGARAAGAG